MSENQITRREFLRLSATLAAGGVLAACAPAAAPSPTAVPTAAATKAAAATVASTAVPPTAAATMAPTAAAATCAKGAICVKATSVKLPTGPATFRWLDSGDIKADFMKALFTEYQKAHPNITCQYDGLPWTEIAKVVPLGVQNGNLHDSFSIPQGVTPAQAVAEGWIRPLDDLIPDLEKVKATFPAGSFVEGSNVFAGKTYTFPFGTNKRSASVLLYNQEYMQKAGLDPVAKPFSWDDYRAAAKKITEQGAGKYYGVIIGGNQLGRWGAVVGDLARLSGMSYISMNFVGAIPEDYIDLKKGEYIFTSDAIVNAIELLLAMKSDNSFFPGFLSINAPQARAQFAQGAAGMILQGLWCIPVWKRDNPGFKYGVAMTPTPTSGKNSPLHVPPGGNNEHWIYAKAKNPEIAADIFYYRATLEGQYAWNKIAGLADPGTFAQAMETASNDPTDLRGLDMQAKLFRVGPAPAVRNTDIIKANLERQAVTPSFEQVVQGLMAGQITGVKKAMQEVKDAYEKELDRALKAAVAKGAKVSRNDYVFPNWDPNKDYLDADYKALK
jgi:multiple sugar transport system substrate-binding protein